MRVANEKLRARMISAQEELDWECYGFTASSRMI